MLIYKITNLVSNKIYIGCSVYSIEKRWKSHVYNKRNNTYLAKTIKKYGKEKFNIELIENCASREQMFEREKFWIKELNSKDCKIGYNMTDGGDTGPIKFGKDNWSYGKKKPKLVELNKSRKGIKHSKEHINKQILSQLGTKRNIETRNKMSETRKKAWINGMYKNIGVSISKSKLGMPSPKRIPIICLNNNRIYECSMIAAKELKLSVGNIHNVIKNKYLHTKGYKFQRLTEDHLIF